VSQNSWIKFEFKNEVLALLRDWKSIQMTNLAARPFFRSALL
jgi:hypothetical protein